MKQEFQVISPIAVNTPALLVSSSSPVVLSAFSKLHGTGQLLSDGVGNGELVTHRHSLQIHDARLGKLQIVSVNTIDYVPATQGCSCQKVTQARRALIRLNDNNTLRESGYFYRVATFTGWWYSKPCSNSRLRSSNYSTALIRLSLALKPGPLCCASFHFACHFLTLSKCMQLLQRSFTYHFLMTDLATLKP